jgi:carboxymethylenebutenolidase
MSLSSPLPIRRKSTGCKYHLSGAHLLAPFLTFGYYRLPGVPPTNKLLRLPFTSIVNIRGDRLYHEHISWDQATALVQIGLMPEYLPYPYALPDGKTPAAGKRFEYRVPAAGLEVSAKLQDQSAVESNLMFAHALREVDDIPPSSI